MKLLHFVGLGTILLASALSACSDKEEVIIDPTPDPEPEPSVKVVNLSEEGMANCYIVTEPGVYKFKADNQFNLGPGLPVPPSISPMDANLIWQTEKGSIEAVTLDNETESSPYIVFNVVKAEGNALISALDDKGDIVWSWHIWMPKEEVSGLKLVTGYEVMNMNLGALNNEPGDPVSYGMLYQWGRKDPFPAAATLTGNTSTISAPMYDSNGNHVTISNSSWDNLDANTLEYSIANPTVCLSNYAQLNTSRDWLRSDLSDNNLWGNPEGDYREGDSNLYRNKGKKTCYDPSPLGWRVPPVDVFRNFTSSGGYVWDFEDFNVADINNDGIITIDDYNYGWCFPTADGEALYFPAAARFDGSYAMLMGSVSGIWGNYWSNSPYINMKGGGFCALSFQIKDMNGNEQISMSAAAGSSRADAYSIRCIRDN